MTQFQDHDLKAESQQLTDSPADEADECNANQERPRFRVEVSLESHQALREEANRRGKHMKDLAEEIFQSYFEGKG
jgi:predicted DsbA family dithiol-disulfide isomerase